MNRSVSLQADTFYRLGVTRCVSFPATSASAAANSGASVSLGFPESGGVEQSPTLSHVAE